MCKIHTELSIIFPAAEAFTYSKHYSCIPIFILELFTEGFVYISCIAYSLLHYILKTHGHD